jgi:hypothetical protein
MELVTWDMQPFIDPAINCKKVVDHEKRKNFLALYINFMEGILEKLKLIGNHYNIKITFRTKYTLSSCMKTRREGDLQQMACCICNMAKQLHGFVNIGTVKKGL